MSYPKRASFGVVCAIVLGLGLGAGAAPVPAWAQSKSAVDMAARLIEKTGVLQQAEAMLPLIMGPFVEALKAAHPGQAQDIDDLVQNLILPDMRAALPEFVKSFSVIYAQHFTEQELKAIIQFYDSPVGKKMIAKQPEMMQQGQALGAAWGREIAMRAIDKHRAKFAEKGIRL